MAQPDDDAYVWSVPITGTDVPGGRLELVLVQTSLSTPVCVLFQQVRFVLDKCASRCVVSLS